MNKKRLIALLPAIVLYVIANVVVVAIVTFGMENPGSINTLFWAMFSATILGLATLMAFFHSGDAWFQWLVRLTGFFAAKDKKEKGKKI